jgi:ribosomal protein L11 methyltransferase
VGREPAGGGVIRLAVRVGPDQAGVVLAELLELAPDGLEERTLPDGSVEYAIYGAEGELPALPDVRAAAGNTLVEVSTSELPDGWEERWRDWHRPLDVDGRAGSIRVRPPWAEPRPGALDVVIEPGQAFGTGAHPTTRLCLQLLADLEPSGALADWGCGSGILAVAAAKLGWDPVSGCDVEAASVHATVAAAEANGVALAIDRRDLRRDAGPWAPTVVANLVRPLLLEVAARLERVPERLLASGLQPDEVDEVAAAFAAHGLELAERRDGDGWSAILLVR